MSFLRYKTIQTLIFFIILIFGTCCFANDIFCEFVTIDSKSGLFLNSQGHFPLLCVTYVQPEEGVPGLNSGKYLLRDFDLGKFRNDFSRMRSMGIRCIYMRIGSGFFLNSEDHWRKIESDSEFSLRVKTLEKVNGVGPFIYFYEIFDYLLDCAQAEGIYVLPVIMDKWSLPRRYELVDYDQAILYEEQWQHFIDDWSKILSRLKDRKVIIGYLFEGEMVHFPTWNEEYWFRPNEPGQRKELVKSPLEANEKRLLRQFQEYLKLRYLTVENLKQSWSYGYNRSKPVYNAKTEVAYYPFNRAVYDNIEGFSEISFPMVERSKTDKGVGRGENFPYWRNVPFDPVWIDFAYFKEWLYTKRLNQMIRRIREVDNNHLIMHSAALDSVPSWHPFYVLWNKGQLKVDVLLHGGGYCETMHDKKLTIKKHETVLELYQSVGLFRPFTLVLGCSAKIFGMGEGGFAFEWNNENVKTQNVSETLEDRWITQLLMDNYGSGAGFANLWDWGVLVGSTVANPKLHEHRVTKTLRILTQSFKKDTFTKNRHAKILILANGHTLHSLIKAASFNNLISLSNILTNLHYKFDIVTTDEISFGLSSCKIDINNYDAIFMPQLFQIPIKQNDHNVSVEASDNIWLILNRWINSKSNRLLCVGLLGMRDAYFSPISSLPEQVRQLVGLIEVSPVQNQKIQRNFTTGFGKTIQIDSAGIVTNYITIDKCEKSTRVFLRDGKKIIGTEHKLKNNSNIYYFGFPLGMSWMNLENKQYTGISIDENNTFSLAGLYENLLKNAGMFPDYQAAETVTVYISDNAKVILIRERDHNRGTDKKIISSSLLARNIYSDATTFISKKGDKILGKITVDLNDNIAKVLTSIGTVEMLKDGEINVVSVPVCDVDGNTKYKIDIQGDISIAKIILSVPNN